MPLGQSLLDVILQKRRTSGVPIQPPNTVGPAFSGLLGQTLSDLSALKDIKAPPLSEMYNPEGKIRRDMMAAAMLAPFGITAFHGSPYKFDKFDMSKIGTGEGAQSYGHGLYFAENPSTATSYQRNLSIKDPLERMVNNMFENRLSAGLSESKAIEQTKKWAQGNPQVKHLAGKVEDIVKQGNLYKVDIPDEAVGKMLSLEQKVGEQPGVAEILQKNMYKLPPTAQYNLWALNGEGLYGSLQAHFAPDGTKRGLEIGAQKASNFLRELGIPGIKYLDQGSRGTGGGTSNFVLFDENLAKILERK